MNTKARSVMRAIALSRFGGIEALQLQELPVPEVGVDEVLLRIESAGVGTWDPYEREGGYAEVFGIQPRFPYVLGSEGAGAIVAVGERVSRYKPGDRVYAAGFLNPKGGFYAEYAAVAADRVAPIPAGLTVDQAGAMSGVGLTALRGLDDILKLQRGESVLIFGGGGGIGHVAVQLAKRMGARVLAVASGDDGAALAKKLGADATVNGRRGDALSAVLSFAPAGFDAALLTAGGEAADAVVSAVRKGGRIAYPNGVQTAPRARPAMKTTGYNCDPDPDLLQRLQTMIEAGPFDVHIDRTFPLHEAAAAHRALDGHYLGKLALRIL